MDEAGLRGGRTCPSDAVGYQGLGGWGEPDVHLGDLSDSFTLRKTQVLSSLALCTFDFRDRRARVSQGA